MKQEEYETELKALYKMACEQKMALELLERGRKADLKDMKGGQIMVYIVAVLSVLFLVYLFTETPL